MTSPVAISVDKAQFKDKQQSFSQTAKLASQFPIMGFGAASTATDNTLIAIGERGHVLSFIDNTWVQVTVPTNVLLTSAFFIDKDHGWAVGHDATIIKTVDGGQQWQLLQQLPELDRPLLDVYFSDVNNGFAVGAYGMYLSTVDGGQHWNKQFLDALLPQDDIDYLAEIKAESEEDYQFEIASILPHFNHISALSDGRLLLVGELGLIALSSDNGVTWQRQKDIYQGSFFSALETTNKTLLVGGLRGNLFRSIDGGQHWSKVSLLNNYSINQLIELSNGVIYIAQNNGVILKSVDDGQSFSQVALFKGQDMMALSEIKQQIWLAGSKGLTKLQQKK